MNPVIDSILQQISVALNSELTREEDHAWIIPSAAPELLLTLIWNEDGPQDELIISLAIGRVDDTQPSPLAMELLTANLGMAVLNGPRLGYSPSSQLITLLDSVACRYGDEVALGEMVASLVAAGVNIRQKVLEVGYRLFSDYPEEH
ncbi:type III secretion system chaperone [Enterobacteriaceae bacterium H20N1]|uniref:Tir chaperone n=1 Tax=Dryocola boscaweniae TaxID=2925397 RepID=A0A9X2W744_9ENTR|nr:type III secretion system chaperone [Dryocola boscaweniae]MCT4700499.1 type III secretion system chaperone [Dryocola boscaweniae]MCT4713449.1 type III secretion system chaperone [Dryocola boscaweniae]MCT4717655.1 type III secretion system chaperone [Dryocola boscaweniae]